MALDPDGHKFQRNFMEVRVRSWRSKFHIFKSKTVKIRDAGGRCRKTWFCIDFRSQNEAFSDHMKKAKIWFSYRRGTFF